MHAYRTHTCVELNKSNVGETVRLSGWVHRVRDHGGVLFIDLRDHFGVTQVIADSDSPVFHDVESLRSEWCVRIDGNVLARDKSLVNPKLPTGEIEVFVRDIDILGKADELPLIVFGDQEYPEETRLKYRYLDLRREKLQNNMKLRSDVIASIRKHMWARNFREYQTPIITASSPEGARDFLVPSRLHPGKFYALPQAPQQFKQLIMVSGFDRYFQIAPCFRDEDPRADRSPTDFYQLLYIFGRFNSKIVANARCNQNFLNTGQGSGFLVEINQRLVVGFQVGTNPRINAGRFSTCALDCFGFTGQAIHICCRATKIGDYTCKSGEIISNFFNFSYD